MNSKTNLTTAKLRRTLLIAALAICPILAINSSYAQPQVVTATLTAGGNNSITITQNQSFTLTLAVTTNFVSSGYSVFYQSTNGSGFFRLVSRTNTSPTFIDPVDGPRPIFNDPTTANSTAFGGNAGLLDPVNDFDLGYTGDQTNNQAAGMFSLQTITINTLNAPAGTYTIVLDRGVMTYHPDPNTFQDIAMAASFTVNVVPEPTTVGLAVIGGGVLLVGAWRKRRAQA